MRTFLDPDFAFVVLPESNKQRPPCVGRGGTDDGTDEADGERERGSRPGGWGARAAPWFARKPDGTTLSLATRYRSNRQTRRTVVVQAAAQARHAADYFLGIKRGQEE